MLDRRSRGSDIQLLRKLDRPLLIVVVMRLVFGSVVVMSIGRGSGQLDLLSRRC
jgi:hypothetical protein